MANMTFKASLLPSTDLGYSLGSTTQKWNIYGNLTGNASTSSALNSFASIGSSSTTHDTALKNYFTSNYSSIPRNKTICFYDASSGNGSLALGYFLSGYNNNPYGGFFVAHYNTPYYVGIQNGTYTNQTILTSSNYTSYTVKKDGTGASGTWGISITGNATTSSSCTGNAATSSSCTGNAATATKLQTTRKINGTDFNGTADITTANWGTARTLTIGNKGQSVNGSQNITWNLQDILIRAGNEFNFTTDGISSIYFNYKTQSGTEATNKITNYYFDNGQRNATGVTIHAENFNGKAASASKWATARTLTIGETGKEVDGTANVSWGKAEILGESDTTKFYRGDQSWSNELTDNLKVKTLTITDTNANEHLKFSRSNNYNYITIPNNTAASLAFGYGTGTTNTLVRLTATTWQPERTNVISLGVSGTRWSKLYVGTADTYGSNTQPIYWNAGVPTAITYTANRLYYPSAVNAFTAGTHFVSDTKIAINSTNIPDETLYVNGNTKINGTLHITPPSGSYVEGIRIYPSSAGWTSIALCGTDNTGTSGTSAATWSLHTKDSNFYLSQNGSSSATVRFTGHNGNGFSIRPRLSINADVNTGYNLYVNGKTLIDDATASSSTNLSSQLIVSNSNSGNVALELWRNEGASWQLANESGVLYLRNNWTTAKQSSYTQSSLIIECNTGNTAISGSLSVGQTTRNTSYKLYVNGTSHLNGSLYMPATSGIYTIGNKATYMMIRFMDNTADTYGNGISIGGGGPTIIGGGESANTMADHNGNNGNEIMYIGNDGNIDFYTNLQNGWDSGKHIYMDTNGDFRGSRYIFANYYNASCGAETPSNASYWIYSNSDGYFRKSSLGNLFNLIRDNGGDGRWVTLTTNQNITGTKTWGSSGAGGQLNGAATNGGINSIRIGDDVWLGDCNAGGIMGMKSTGTNCGFYFYNSSGTQIGYLYAQNNQYLTYNKSLHINGSSIGSSWVDSRSMNRMALSVDASDATSSVAYSICGIRFQSKTFAISSERADNNFGIYGWNNSRTENGFDWAFYVANDGYFHCNTRVYGAVWNDYAEMRNVPEAQNKLSKVKPGMCVQEVGDDTMIMATERLQRGCKVISDTFGFNIGETEDCKTPIAVSGRALVYLYESREEAKTHIGWPVCSGPNGTVSIMTEEEEEKYPSRIVGTISAVPDYEEWGTGKVKVDGRIWIYVK